MDIMTLILTGAGCFGAGLTLGAMTMSPRCGPWIMRRGPDPRFESGSHAHRVPQSPTAYQVTQNTHTGMIAYSGAHMTPVVVLTETGHTLAYLPDPTSPAALPEAAPSRLEVER